MGGGGESHTAGQTAPIQLGTSGGNVTDFAARRGLRTVFPGWLIAE